MEDPTGSVEQGWFRPGVPAGRVALVAGGATGIGEEIGRVPGPAVELLVGSRPLHGRPTTGGAHVCLRIGAVTAVPGPTARGRGAHG